MSLFLLRFDRKSHEASLERIDDPEEAMRRLLMAEDERRDRPELEVVLLTARDEKDLRRTHSRFFESLGDLLELAETAT